MLTLLLPHLRMSTQSLSLSLWNANGLRVTTIQDSLSHVLNSDIFFITETWLTPPMVIPTDWTQYHIYGSKVAKANNRGSGGVAALVNPHCRYPVSQLPSPNSYTLSLKIGALRVHCVYLPPSLRLDHVFDILNSIPLLPDTIICGDFNARLGELLGDSNTNPRGLRLLLWLADRQLSVLNETLANGVATFTAFRRGVEVSSIIDLFITNMDPSVLLASLLNVECDLSLGSDHRLMTLSFDYVPSQDDATSVAPTVLAPRRLWNLSRLGKEDTLKRYRSQFYSLVSPVLGSMSALVASPPLVRPDIDMFNDRINECIYSALDASVGNKPTRPGYWKKYWTPALQNAAKLRDDCYCKWRRSSGIDKIYWYNQHKTAHAAFRSAVQAAKRASWKSFCASLETDFSKATATIKRIKRRHASSSSFSHPSGPAAAVDVMSTHLESVYNGSFLPDATPRSEAPPAFDEFLPHDLPASPLLSADNIKHHLRNLALRKAPGPDHLKAEMLQPLAPVLLPVLSVFFQLCWQWSYTPVLWRQATVFPIHKKGDVSDPANYRPISLTSVMRKLFEHTISASVVSHSPPLDIAQGGFRPQRSPLDQALCLHDLMRDYYEVHRHYPSVAFLDIKAAYDTVDRRVIWRALSESSTLPRPLLALLVNLFDEVMVSVLISNHSSIPFAPATGVLQGSVLSPHLYSIYINSLPGILRQVASATTTTVTLPGASSPIAVNSLLFADDVAIFGTKVEVQQMLDLAAQHSFALGYRWNPAKCAIINAPSPTSSTSQGFRLKLYGEAIPVVSEFVYLGMPFGSNGLVGSSINTLRSPGAKKTMALLTSIGVHRNGFSLLLCARLYACFIRPKLEYGLAISKFLVSEMKQLEATQDRLVGMFIGSNRTKVAKHITCLHGMVHRYNTLVSRYVLRARYLPPDSLVILLRDSVRYSRLNELLVKNPLYKSLPDPLPPSAGLIRNHFINHWQNYFDEQMVKSASNGKDVHLRACRPSVSQPDPILYLPMSTTARSRLVRWRLGRTTAMAREECPCMFNGVLISRDHFLYCRAIDPDLVESLPTSPPGVNRIDYAISSLPLKARDGPPDYWPALLSLLWYIDTLCHPSKHIPEDPHPGSSWFSLPG